MSEEFTDDDVAGDFVQAIATEVVERLGWSPLRDYGWGAEDDDGTWPFTVERDGRKFEVDIDVRVTELTPELLARRKADTERLQAAIATVLANRARRVSEGSK